MSDAFSSLCDMPARIYSIGHGLLELDQFVENLGRYDVSTVVDVRSHPVSARAPRFDRQRLERALRDHGVAYRWAGETLGGRPAAHLMTPGGVPDYERMSAEPATTRALDFLVHLATERTVAMMCSESRPENCHRTRMLEPQLEHRGARVEHILPTGELLALPTLFA